VANSSSISSATSPSGRAATVEGSLVLSISSLMRYTVSIYMLARRDRVADLEDVSL
jgi:hypothetical protein